MIEVLKLVATFAFWLFAAILCIGLAMAALYVAVEVIKGFAGK